jgi:hypothetical protein
MNPWTYERGKRLGDKLRALPDSVQLRIGRELNLLTEIEVHRYNDVEAVRRTMFERALEDGKLEALEANVLNGGHFINRHARRNAIRQLKKNGGS